MKTVLAFETSCDETAVAILRGGDLLASEVASQIGEHQKYGGVVPEIASRNHLVHTPRLLRRAVADARLNLSDIDAFAATSGPGLASSLMIGASTAKGLAIGFNKPYLAINHLEGHLLSPFFGDEAVSPNLALIVSGGHTLTVRVGGVSDYHVVGRTVDDAAGEAFDKVAKLLGLGYPGGPEIEDHARAGDSTRFDFPRSMPDSPNFSFSGLKTAVRYLLPKLGRVIDGQMLADVCASFQQAVIDVLVRRIIQAAKESDLKLVTLSGGVSCNRELCSQVDRACQANALRFKPAPGWLSTDNAAMIAFAASLHLDQGMTSSVTEEINPNLGLA
jgi:N6-L-threonylcarbamoyladenine synthase